MALDLPLSVAQRIRAFLDAGHSGQIVLDVKDGRVQQARITEYVKATRHDDVAAIALLRVE